MRAGGSDTDSEQHRASSGQGGTAAGRVSAAAPLTHRLLIKEKGDLALRTGDGSGGDMGK